MCALKLSKKFSPFFDFSDSKKIILTVLNSYCQNSLPVVPQKYRFGSISGSVYCSANMFLEAQFKIQPNLSLKVWIQVL